LRNGEEEAFIIGGAKIYEQTMDIIDTLYYTEVDAEPAGDVFFPKIDWDQWKLESAKSYEANEKNMYPFAIKKYNKIR
jgi:dihydrofolate reductase